LGWLCRRRFCADAWHEHKPEPQYASLWHPRLEYANLIRNGFGRFCSSEFALVSAFSWNGIGTTECVYLNGEESVQQGGAFANIATGSEAGTTYELPRLSDFS